MSRRIKKITATILTAGLIVSSMTACSPRNTEAVQQDSKGEEQQSLPQGSDSKKENADQENQEGASQNTEQPNEANKNTDRKKQESSQDAPQAKEENKNEEQALAETQSAPAGSNKNTESDTLTQEQKDFYINQYISMNPFPFQSWSDPETIESFRFGTFYGHNAINDPNYSPEQYAVEDTPNYEIPQAVFEEFIQMYFNVSSEHLRTSRFYDAENEIYTGFLAGEGAPAEYEVESAKTTGSVEEITYRAVDENGETKVTIGVDHSGDHFKFVFVKRE